MIILLHSSKTMRWRPQGETSPSQPLLLDRAEKLDAYLKTLSPQQLADVMRISDSLAAKTHDLIVAWSTEPKKQSLAIDSFVGDIYSGLRASELSKADRDYANQTLKILSGLYGIIRPYDGICPYRLEMEYKLPAPGFANLYHYWGKSIVDTLPTDGLIINTSSVEYSRTVTPFVDSQRVVTPKFLTLDSKSREPKFVVVHAKIARGAFARWLIQSRTVAREKLTEFNDLGYAFSQELSTPNEPTFVCRDFGGIGLSTRLS